MEGRIEERIGAVTWDYDPVTVEASALVLNGPRQATYGHPLPWGERCAAVWSALFGWSVTAEQVALAMIAFKLCREVNSHHRDNLVDAAGYAECANRIIEAKRALTTEEDE